MSLESCIQYDKSEGGGAAGNARQQSRLSTVEQHELLDHTITKAKVRLQEFADNPDSAQANVNAVEMDTELRYGSPWLPLQIIETRRAEVDQVLQEFTERNDAFLGKKPMHSAQDKDNSVEIKAA